MLQNNYTADTQWQHTHVVSAQSYIAHNCLHTVISKTYDIRLFIQLLHTSTAYKQNILLLPYIQRALSSILNLSNNILAEIAHIYCCMCWYYKINTTSTSLETNVYSLLPEYVLYIQIGLTLLPSN